jgi:hypothetical protein
MQQLSSTRSQDGMLAGSRVGNEWSHEQTILLEHPPLSGAVAGTVRLSSALALLRLDDAGAADLT